MALREVLVEFGAIFTGGPELKKADDSVKGVLDRVKNLAAGLAAALGVGAIGRMTAQLINEADALDETAAALQMNTQELQAMQLAGQLNALSTEEMNGALFRFNRAVSDAEQATSPAAKAFKELGVNVKNASGELETPMDLLMGVAQGLSQVESPAKRAGLVVDLFGRAGQKLLPFLSQGPEGIRKFAKEAEALGGGFSPEFVERAGEIDNQMHRLNFAMRSLKVVVLGFFLPAILTVVSKLKDWAAAGARLVKTTSVVQTALVIFGGVAVVQFARIVSALRPLLLRLALIAAPLVLAALALEDLITWWQGGESAIGDFLDAWFGEGASEKVRAWFAEVATGFSEMVADAKEGGDKFRDNWRGALELAVKDTDREVKRIKDFFYSLVTDDDWAAGFVRLFGEVFAFIVDLAGGAKVALIDTFFVVINMLTGGWQQFWTVFGALLDAGLFSFQVVWEDIAYIGAITAASFQDAWELALAGIDTAANSVIGTISDLLAMIPGAQGLADDLRATAPEAKPGAGENRDLVRAERERRIAALTDRAQDIDNRLRGRVSAPVGAGAGGAGGSGDTNIGQVNVPITLPAGTPAATREAARQGAAQGVREGVAAGRTAGRAGGAPNRAAKEAIKGRAPAK